MDSSFKQSLAHTRQRADELQTLFDIQQAITSRLDPDAVMQLIAEAACRLTASTQAILFLLEGDLLRIVAESSESTSKPGQSVIGYRMPAEGSLAELALQTQKPVYIADAPTDPHVNADPRRRALVDRSGVQSLMAVPLIADSRPLGVISISNKLSGQFGPDDERVLTMLASSAVIGLENARLYQEEQKRRQTAVLEERGRLARELHDSVTQSLYSLTLLAEGWRRMVEAGNIDNVAEYLTELGQIAQQALKEMRLLIYELRPQVLEEERLVGALQQRLDAVEGRAGVEARLLVDDKVDNLPNVTQKELYRIALEALNNALKHAAATTVTLKLTVDEGQVHLGVSDDGQGFSPDKATNRGGLGLTSMRERVEKLHGTFNIRSAPKNGTTIKVSLPLAEG